MKACNFLSCVAMRASSASTTVTGDSRRAAISAARRWAGRKLGSVLLAGISVPQSSPAGLPRGSLDGRVKPGHDELSLRIEAAVDPGRADIVAHEGADALAPRVAVAGPLPGR